MKVVWLVRTRARGRTWRQYNRRYVCVWSGGGIGSTTGNNPPPLIHKTRAEAESTALRFQSQYGMYEEAKVVARRVDEAAPLRNARAAFVERDVTYSEGDARVTLESFRAIRDMMRRSR